MADGSDAIADWPILNALVNTASGASWVSVHHGGGVGIGRSIHAGQVCVADGTPLAGAKLERVLTNDPATGVIRHVDAGYERAAEVAAERGVTSRWIRYPNDSFALTARGRAVHAARPSRLAAPAARNRRWAGDDVSFAALWESLLPIGRDPATGGYRRFSWTTADMSCRDWFAAAAAERAMDVAADGNGNLWAWWDTPSVIGPAVTGESPAHAVSRAAAAPPAGAGVSRGGAVVAGSHLDSVPDGGAFDGPLGVVSAFARSTRSASAASHPRARSRSRRSPRRRARGSAWPALAAGCSPARSRAAAARGLRDAGGVSLAEAMAAAGGEPDLLGPDDELPDRVAAYVELHIEQGRQLADLDAVIGVGGGIWPHGRWRFDFRGRADHAGTTALPDRRDPMLPFAATALAARAAAHPPPRARYRSAR